MRAVSFGTLLIGAAFVFAGCHGSSSTLPSAPASIDAAQASGTDAATKPPGKIVVVLPTIVNANALPTPNPTASVFLSSGTQSVSGTYGKTSFGPIDISTGSSNCQAVSGAARSCTITVQVPSGASQLTLTTNGAKASFGRLAFVPKTRIKVLAGVSNYVKPLKWFGVATGVDITASPKKVSQFKPVQVTLTVTGVDGSGARIPDRNFIFTTGGGVTTETTATGPYNQSLSVLNYTPTQWSYDGRFQGKETFTTTATALGKTVAKATVTLRMGAGQSSSLGQIIAGTQSGGETSLAEFESTADGNVAPLRNVVASTQPYSSLSVPYGASSNGDFWVGGRQYDTLGDAVGTIQAPGRGQLATAYAVDAAQNEFVAYRPSNNASCGTSLHVYVFAAGSYGKTISRNLIGPTVCSPTALAVDGTGVLYAYGDREDGADPELLEFPANTSGNVPPSLTIQDVQLSNLVGDATGNLYALVPANGGDVVKFAPGTSTPVTVLTGLKIAAFALDSQGNIYASIPLSSTTYQIEEFPAGATSPTRIIGGPNTGLTISGGITVMP
jgi:hypothetical protein